MKGLQYCRNGVFQPFAMETVLAVTGGGRRSEILRCLAVAPQDVSTLADVLELSVNLVSHNLSILRDHGLVEVTRSGLRHVYRLSQSVRSSVRGHSIRLKIRCAKGEWVVLHATCNSLASS
jgi:DNA-binding transcriptional ArsR family regulator